MKPRYFLEKPSTFLQHETFPYLTMNIRDDKKDLYLEPGVHEYPFDFVLPPVYICFILYDFSDLISSLQIAPSSFHPVAIALEKDQSKIKYTVKG